jgi:hypothetical protein
MYEPAAYLERCLRHCLAITPSPQRAQQMHFPPLRALRLLALLIWRQGVCRGEIRAQFWRQLLLMARRRPQLVPLYLSLCAAGEHFFEYRQLARLRISDQLGHDALRQPAAPAAATAREPALTGPV